MVVSTMNPPLAQPAAGNFFAPYQGFFNGMNVPGYGGVQAPAQACASQANAFEAQGQQLQQPTDPQAAGFLNFVRTKSAPCAMENEFESNNNNQAHAAPQFPNMLNLNIQPANSSGSGSGAVNALNFGTGFNEPLNFNWNGDGFTQVASNNSSGSNGHLNTDGTEFLNVGHNAPNDIKQEPMEDAEPSAQPMCDRNVVKGKEDKDSSRKSPKKGRKLSMHMEQDKTPKFARSVSADNSQAGSPVDDDLKRGDVGNYVARTAKGLSYDLDKVDEGLARRLIKNRVSAERSRQRKIQQWNEMVSSLSKKDEEIAKLQQQNSALNTENEDLKQRLANMEAMLMRQTISNSGGSMNGSSTFMNHI